MFEIFNPADGVTLYTVPFAWVARLITHFNHSLDYAHKGEGWVN